MIRIMMYTANYTDQILSVINEVPKWMNNGDTTRIFWSENHMIMYMSTSYLMLEHFNSTKDPNVRERLLWYLNTHIKYGYYEFFSHTYLPYSLAGLLNLYDFSIDPEIKHLSGQAATRLLNDMVLATNSKGGFFPVSGRSFTSKYIEAFGANHQSVLAVLTGKGARGSRVSTGEAFLACSTLNVSSIIAAYSDTVSTTLVIGHKPDDFDEIFGDLSDKYDQQAMKFSMGCYFHPACAADTFDFAKHFELFSHDNFKMAKSVSWMPSGIATPVSHVIAALGSSSLLSANMPICKYKSVMISSLDDYFKGYSGHQNWPWMATTGTSSVFTATGEITGDWTDRSKQSHTHFPYIKQKQNVLLLMYQPNRDLKFLGISDLDVGLYWPEEEFNETAAGSGWLFGKEDDGYVAVRPACSDTIGNVVRCSADRQIWACVVGHKDLHGGFENFTRIVQSSMFEDNVDGRCMSGKIEVDGQLIELEWCKEIGPLVTTIIVFGIYLIMQCTCCFICCRGQRRVWKMFCRNTTTTCRKMTGKVDEMKHLDSKPSI
uniref:Uncharacterized protein n=1 Tax=Aplanochytrium stocchinoi TaxID=215587 RepID=A0A7S3PMC5_9STRA